MMRQELFEELEASIGQMQRIRRGKLAGRRATDLALAKELDVAALRARFGLSQAKFAALLGISVRTLQGWEQGRRSPEGPARVLLRVAARRPKAVLETAKGR
jgi:putative transcriptional regulator